MMTQDSRGMHSRDLGSSRVSRGGKCNTRAPREYSGLKVMGWAAGGLWLRPRLVTIKGAAATTRG